MNPDKSPPPSTPSLTPSFASPPRVPVCQAVYAYDVAVVVLVWAPCYRGAWGVRRAAVGWSLMRGFAAKFARYLVCRSYADTKAIIDTHVAESSLKLPQGAALPRLLSSISALTEPRGLPPTHVLASVSYVMARHCRCSHFRKLGSKDNLALVQNERSRNSGCSFEGSLRLQHALKHGCGCTRCFLHSSPSLDTPLQSVR